MYPKAKKGTGGSCPLSRALTCLLLDVNVVNADCTWLHESTRIKRELFGSLIRSCGSFESDKSRLRRRAISTRLAHWMGAVSDEMGRKKPSHRNWANPAGGNSLEEVCFGSFNEQAVFQLAVASAIQRARRKDRRRDAGHGAARFIKTTSNQLFCMSGVIELSSLRFVKRIDA